MSSSFGVVIDEKTFFQMHVSNDVWNEEIQRSQQQVFKSSTVLCIYLLLDILGASNSIKCLSLLQGSYFKPFYLSKKGWKGCDEKQYNLRARPKGRTRTRSFIVFLRRLVNATPSATWTPSGCCNRPTFCRLLTAYRRKSIAADPAEFLFLEKREEKKRSALKPRKRKKTQRENLMRDHQRSYNIARSSLSFREKRETYPSSGCAQKIFPKKFFLLLLLSRQKTVVQKTLSREILFLEKAPLHGFGRTFVISDRTHE